MMIGLFGGTFDPVHFGHVNVVEEVQRYFFFDKIYFVLSEKPPHKNANGVVSAYDRYEMLRLSMPYNLFFDFLMVMLNRCESSYAVDTVDMLSSAFSCYSRFFFIIGFDAFIEIHTWKFYRDLIKHVEIIVVSRPKENFINIFDDIEMLGEYIFNKISVNCFFSENTFSWTNLEVKSIYYLCIKPCVVSSSLVRSMIKRRQYVDELVSNNVILYIKRKGFYL